MRFLKVFAFGLGFGVFGSIVLAVFLFAATRTTVPDRHLPDGPTLVEKVREIARLETLDVRAYKKLTYDVDPPATEGLLQGLTTWVKFSADPPVGRAIVFADVHIGFDLSKIDETTLRVDDDVVTVVLPPLMTTVEIRPGETEVVSSNLDSQQTAELLDRGKWAIQADVEGDPALAERARESAKTSLRNFLMVAGFREVVFVDELAPLPVASPVPAT